MICCFCKVFFVHVYHVEIFGGVVWVLCGGVGGVVVGGYEVVGVYCGVVLLILIVWIWVLCVVIDIVDEVGVVF